MTKKLFTLLFYTLCTLLVSATEYNVSNASFEAGAKSPADWFLGTHKRKVQFILIQGSHSGQKALAIKVLDNKSSKLPFARSGGQHCKKKIPAKPDQQVVLTVMAKSPNRGIVKIGLTSRKGDKWAGSASSPLITLGANWQKIELKAITGRNTDNLEINLMAQKGTVIFDDVKLVQEDWLKTAKPQSCGEFWLNVDYFCLVNWCDHFGYKTYREPEIEQLFKRCAANHVTGVFWRVSMLGQMNYPTKTGTVFPGRVPMEKLSKGDQRLARILQEMDPLAVAVRYARKYNVKICVWMTLSDEHSGNKKFMERATNNLVLDHPEYMLQDKNGKPFRGSICYSFPETRKYRLDVLRELVKYKTDGIFMSTKSHAFYHGKDSGYQYGYNKPIVDEYKKRYGVNILKEKFDIQKWLKIRAEGWDKLMKEATKIVHGANQKLYLGIKAASNEVRGWPYGRALMPWRGWIRKKWLDGVVVGHYYIDLIQIATDSKAFHKVASPEQKIFFWQQLWNYQKRAMTPFHQMLLQIQLINYSGANGGVYHEAMNLEENIDNYWKPLGEEVKKYWMAK